MKSNNGDLTEAKDTPDALGICLDDIETVKDLNAKIAQVVKVITYSHRLQKRLNKDSVTKQRAYKEAYARAIVAATGNKELSNAEIRKATAELATLDQWEIAELAKLSCDNATSWLYSVRGILTAIQSIGAALRDEMALAGRHEPDNRIKHK